MTPTDATPPYIPHTEFRQHLGSGGFADVYLYRQHIPERDIAVKVIRSDASAEQNGAFEAEANLMAKMSAHPAILSVFGAGVSDDGRSYLVMEYCPPPHLGVRARKQQFPVTTVLDIGIRIAGAVETLHRAGVLHRDIKPANILITQFGHPVLTDFGIAVSTQHYDKHADAGFSIPWAPPEQATGKGMVGPTLDVYSLGATLHTLLTGHSPFEVPGGDNREISLLNRVLREPVPPTGRSDVPPELERILAIAMSKKPEQRYPTVLGFAQALQQIQEDMHQRPTPIDVLDDHVDHHADESDDEATRVRAFTVIDPSGPVSTPGPTRLTLPITAAQVPPSASVSPPHDGPATPGAPNFPPGWSGTSDDTRARVRTQTLYPHLSATVPAPRGDRCGDDADDKTVIRLPQEAVNASYAGTLPHFAPPTKAQSGDTVSSVDGAAHSPAVDDQQQAMRGVNSSDAMASRKRGRPLLHIIATIAVLVCLSAVVAFGVWSYLRQEGLTQRPQETPVHEMPDSLPTAPTLEPVTGLKGSLGSDGKVTFTWDRAPNGDYLYRVADPLENHPMRHTTEPQATVDKVDGRTCLEVFVRQADGSTSDRAIECVETP